MNLTFQPLTADLVPALATANAADHGHFAPFASRVFLRDGEIIGAAGLVPTLTFWAHSEKASPRESFVMARAARAAAGSAAQNWWCLCTPESPFHPHMTRFGFRRVGSADFFQAV